MSDEDSDFFGEQKKHNRLSQLSVGEARMIKVGRGYTNFIKSLRFILPLAAIGMTAIVLTWDEAGKRVEPMKKHELLPASENIQNELLKPVFNSVDDKNQPYTVTADTAVQSRENPEIVELTNPVAGIDMNDGSKLNAKAKVGLYEQSSQKLNLEGDVEIENSDGTVLKTQELRIDMVTQKAYSGQDVHVENPSGTIDSTGLEGDVSTGTLIFTGPAKVILYSDGNMLSPTPKASTP